MSDLEYRHLRHLYVGLELADEQRRTQAELLEDFVLEMRDAGSSARGLAETLGVSASAVQMWTKNARRRRNG